MPVTCTQEKSACTMRTASLPALCFLAEANAVLIFRRVVQMPRAQVADKWIILKNRESALQCANQHDDEY